MADSGNLKIPSFEAKKEGSKKRRKHKKPTAASGDGAPSSTSSTSNQNQTVNHTQTRSEGATANVKISQDRQENKHHEKCTTKQVDDKPQIKGSGEIKENKFLETLSQNQSGKEGKTNETQGKGTENQGSKGGKDSESREKDLEKEAKVNDIPVQNSPKEGNASMDGEYYILPGKQKGKVEIGNKTLTAEIQCLSGKETLDSKTSGKVEALQKGSPCENPEQIQKDDPNRNKDSAELKQTATVKAKAKIVEGENKPKTRVEIVEDEHKPKTKAKIIGGEHKPKIKGEPGQKPEDEGEQKSKAQLRAERRAVQEAQRAAKDAKKSEATGGSSARTENSVSTVKVKIEPASNKSKLAGEKPKPSSEKPKPVGEVAGGEKSSKKKPTISAVIQNETEEQTWARKEKEMLGKSLKIKLDNSILNLGFQYFHHNIVGANARCVALLATLKEVIAKYRTPEEKDLSRDLEKNLLNPCISYLNYCRPISTSMGNAIRHLKYHINRIPNDMDDETAISKLLVEIDNFIEEHIKKAAEGVAHYANTKIDNGDVILVYAASSLIGQVLKIAFQKENKKFHVIVVEGRPRSEGKSMLRFLVRCGIPCSYVYIGSASHAMSQATKVFLGAAAMFAIGDMYSRSGNSMIAALAKANNIPVLVCCETYKFTDKVQLHTGDSNLHNQGKDLVSIGHKTPILANYEEIGLHLLNLMYDVTGSEYITAVVTELGMLPCTSVPVVLRRQEDLY